MDTVTVEVYPDETEVIVQVSDLVSAENVTFDPTGTSIAPEAVNVDKALKDLDERIVSFSAGVDPPYQVTLSSVTTITISQATHGKSSVRGILLLNPSFYEVSVAWKVDASQLVTIESNSDLLDHILKIY